MSFIINLLCAFGGTLAFTILFNIDRTFYLYCGLTGMAGWAVYLAVEPHTSATVATLVGSLVVVFLSRIFSMWKKCPITVFMIAGIFPLIPGSSIYYMAYYFVIGDYIQAALKGIEAIKISFAIVAGIHVIDSIPPKIFKKKYWAELRIKLRGYLQGKR